MKKILIINATQIGENSGTGNTLNNLFKLLPKDHLMQLVVMPESGKIWSDIQTIYTPMSTCRIPYGIIKHRMNNQEQYKPLPANTVGGVIRNNKPTQIIKECARAMLDAWPVSCKDLYDQINCFKPEMIYTCAASIRIMQIANIISEHYGIPIVVHLMDDWPKVLYSSSIVLRPFRKRMKRELARLYDHSDMNFAISEGLCTKYESIFHKKHIPLMNPAIIQPYTSSSRGNEGTVKFLYAGSLSLKRDESLLEIAQILKRLNDEGFTNKFDLYVSKKMITKYNCDRFSVHGVRLHEYVPVERVYDLYSDYDILIFTESFDQMVSEFTELSLSTKVPEYLASGNAIFAYVPKNIFSGHYLQSHGLASVVNRKADLYTELKRMITNPEYRSLLGRRGYEAAKKSFSAECVKQKLETVFA